MSYVSVAATMRIENSRDGLQICLLGELEVVARGRTLTLPPSRKTRALLGYLVLCRRPQRRERLCELLWDVADDPRAALRWSLTKLREIVDDDGARRLGADREHVWLDLRTAYVDVLELEQLLGGSLTDASTPALEAARALFRGELLEGLDLPDFHGYYAWCVAERKLWRERHRNVLETLLSRAGGQPDKTLPLVRELVHLDPLDEGARAQLLELLHASGKIREAEEQSRANRRLLSDSLPAADSAPLPATTVGAQRASRVDDSPELPARCLVSADEVPFVGRRAELERIRAWFARQAGGTRIALVGGDPGVGKSRLVRELAREAASGGARVVMASVPEVRPGFSYAPWLELLNALGADRCDADVPEGLAQLWSPTGAAAGPDGRKRLFHEVAAFVERSARDVAGLLLVIDDVHWLDDASAELLHFVARSLRKVRVDLLLTARFGELHDQPQVARVLRALRREGALEEFSLVPLTREETFELIARMPAAAAAEDVYRQSAGNPLFALELAREARRDGAVLPRSVSRLVRDRLAALSPEQADVLRWAAVLGGHFDVDLLASLVSPTPDALVDKLEQLERFGWLTFDVDASDAANVCAFSHDIVRSSVYEQLSEPRRRLMHARVARMLGARNDSDGPLAASVAHHAALGGDRAMAARACLTAGRRSLRLFAHNDAATLARRGLSYAQELPDLERTSLSIELLELRLNARTPSSPEQALEELAALTSRAIDLGLITHARRGFYLRASLLWEDGRAADAGFFSRESERISRLGDARDRVSALAEAARCLAVIERELPEAEAFLLEAEAIGKVEGVEPLTMPLARGLLSLHRGELDVADATLERAREIARREGDRLEEFYAIEPRVEVALQRRDYEHARALSGDLLALAERLRHGSEAPFARALVALCRYARAEEGSANALELALSELAVFDAKHRRARLLVRAAEIELSRGEWDLARARGAQALALAQAMERMSEAALALAMLVRVSHASGGRPDASHVDALRGVLEGPLSAEAREAARSALTVVAAGESEKGKRHGARHRRTKLC